MFELTRRLAEELAGARVEIEVPDPNTAVFRGVPTGPDGCRFSKPRANMLVKRAREGLPFVVCVDEDLSYLGERPSLARAFGSGPVQEGWRVLLVEHSPGAGFQAAVERGLRALGFGEREPCVAPREGSRAGESLLETLADDLTERVRAGDAPVTVGRREECRRLLACLRRWSESRLALLVGHSGVGKSNLLWLLARRLVERDSEMRVLRVSLGRLFAATLFDSDRESLFARLLEEAGESDELVLAVERLELALRESPHGASLLAEAVEGGLPLAGTTLPPNLQAFDSPPLARRVQIVPVPELGAREAAAVLEALREPLAEHHHVTIAESLPPVAVRAARSLPGHFPGKAVTILDEAAARAAILGAEELSTDDVLAAAARCQSHPGSPPGD